MNMEKTETLSYKLDVFEGPLDLLLNLIVKNKLNIYDIPIAELLEQYMAQIHEMQAADMDVASEFLEMAARLVHIKSVSLLPKKEEEAALKQELTGQLLEYQQCKEAAMRLRERFSLDGIVRAQADIPADLTYKHHHKPQELLSAYLSMFGKRSRRSRRSRRTPSQSSSHAVWSPWLRKLFSCCAACGKSGMCR